MRTALGVEHGCHGDGARGFVRQLGGRSRPEPRLALAVSRAGARATIAAPELHADLFFFAALAVGLAFLVFYGLPDRRTELLRINDFSGFWAGARALVVGADPYDPVTWMSTVATLGTQPPDTAVYGYLPWVALALTPLALLPLDVAAWLWMVASVTLAALAIRVLMRAFLPGQVLLHGVLGLTLVMSQPAYLALVLGQWSFLLLAAVSLVVIRLRARRSTSAALAAGAFLIKPQLFVFALLGLLRRALDDRDRRFIVVLAITYSAIPAIATLMMTNWLSAWTVHVIPVRLVSAASVPAALSDLVGPLGTVAGYALVALGALVAMRFAPSSEASLAAWLALSSAGVVYSWSYDHLLLLVPLVIAGGVLQTEGRRAWCVVLPGAALLLFGSPLLYALAIFRHRETFSAIVPVLMFVIIVLGLWPLRQRSATPAAAIPKHPAPSAPAS